MNKHPMDGLVAFDGGVVAEGVVWLVLIVASVFFGFVCEELV